MKSEKSLSRQEQMVQMVSSTQFWSDLIGEKQRAVIENIFAWSRRVVKTHEGCFWVARIFRRGFIFLSLDPRPTGDKTKDQKISRKWRDAKAKLEANGYSMNRCLEEINALTNLLSEDGQSQFQGVFEERRKRNRPRINKMLDNIQYTNQDGSDKTFDEVYQQLNSIGDTTLEQRILAQDVGIPVVQFPDKSKWVRLKGCSSTIEGELMGHCGNSAGRPTDIVYSFRQPSTRIPEEGYFEPHLTFVTDPDGKLGEMKGNKNQNPNKQYHPYIVGLLKQPFITGLTGTGYLPQNNFSLNDLNDELFVEVCKARPDIILFQIKNVRTQYQVLRPDRVELAKKHIDFEKLEKSLKNKKKVDINSEDNPLPE